MHDKWKNNSEVSAISFQQGEEKGFVWFFKQLYPALSFYTFKITGDKEASEEIASNAFIKIWEKHQRFNDADSIKNYLYRIVRNDAFKHLAKEKRKAQSNKEVIYLYGDEQEKDHFSSLVRAETLREILNAIKDLPTECSKVFHLLYVEGKSIQEAAKELNLSTSTIKTQKARGLIALRKTITILFIISIMLYSTT